MGKGGEEIVTCFPVLHHTPHGYRMADGHGSVSGTKQNSGISLKDIPEFFRMIVWIVGFGGKKEAGAPNPEERLLLVS